MENDKIVEKVLDMGQKIVLSFEKQSQQTYEIYKRQNITIIVIVIMFALILIARDLCSYVLTNVQWSGVNQQIVQTQENNVNTKESDK